MKKITLLLAVFLLLGVNKVNAQLEIIDKIAEVLLPGIVKGVKEISESTKKKEIKKEAEKLSETVTNGINLVLLEFEKDQKNLDALNKFFLVSGQLYDDLGGLSALSNKEFLDEVLKTNSHKLFTEVAKNFDDNLVALSNKQSDMKKIAISSSDASLQSDLRTELDKIDTGLARLLNTIKRGQSITTSMSYETAKSYIENINRTNTVLDIQTIKVSVGVINSKLSSWIESVSADLKNKKQKLEKTLK